MQPKSRILTITVMLIVIVLLIVAAACNDVSITDPCLPRQKEQIVTTRGLHVDTAIRECL